MLQLRRRSQGVHEAGRVPALLPERRRLQHGERRSVLRRERGIVRQGLRARSRVPAIVLERRRLLERHAQVLHRSRVARVHGGGRVPDAMLAVERLRHGVESNVLHLARRARDRREDQARLRLLGPLPRSRHAVPAAVQPIERLRHAEQPTLLQRLLRGRERVPDVVQQRQRLSDRSRRALLQELRAPLALVWLGRLDDVAVRKPRSSLLPERHVQRLVPMHRRPLRREPVGRRRALRRLRPTVLHVGQRVQCARCAVRQQRVPRALQDGVELSGRGVLRAAGVQLRLGLLLLLRVDVQRNQRRDLPVRAGRERPRQQCTGACAFTNLGTWPKPPPSASRGARGSVSPT